MELKNIKFSNIERKRIFNTGKLPGFTDGFAADKSSNYPSSSTTSSSSSSTGNTSSGSTSSSTSSSGTSSGYTNSIGDWMNALQLANSSKTPIPSKVDTSIFPKSGNANFAGLKSADRLIKDWGTPELQKQDTTVNKSGGINGNSVSLVIGALPGLIGSMYNAFTDYSDSNEYIALYRPTSANVAGVGYLRLLKAKNGKLPKYGNGALGNIASATASGAAAGSVAGPWGAAIGGAVGLVGSSIGEIVSGNKDRELRDIASNYIQNVNNANRNWAIGTAMRMQNAEQFGNQGSLMLWGHKNGKLPRCNEGTIPTFTPYGAMYGLKPNALGAPGETIVSPDGTYQVLPGNPSNEDIIPINVGKQDTVVTNKKGLSKKFLKTGDLAGVQAAMAYYKKHGYKNGKMPKYAEGWLGNAITSGLGGIVSLAQYINAKNERPYYPNTYAANPYETQALTKLGGLRINPYPIMQQMRNAEARTNRNIDIAGGLSGGLRNATRLAAMNSTLNNIYNALSNINALNNAYQSAFANAALEAGNKSRAARMSANQWDLDMYSKAHAARLGGMQMGIRNLIDQTQQYYKNEFARNQFNDTLGLYKADLKQKLEADAWLRNYLLNQANRAKSTKLNNLALNDLLKALIRLY